MQSAISPTGMGHWLLLGRGASNSAGLQTRGQERLTWRSAWLSCCMLQTLLLQAYVHRGQQLLPELQARLSQLRYTLDTVKARCRNTGATKGACLVC